MIPLVLLPGMMCDARLFGPQITAFSSQMPVMCAPIGAHDTITMLAEEVLCNAPPRFALAGVSMGGIVAMEILKQAPERVLGVALMDTNPLAENADVKARRGPQIEAARAGDLYRVMRDEMKPNYLADGPVQESILELCMDMAQAIGPEVFVNQSVALRDRVDQTDVLRTFPRPALVLCGRSDRLCPVSRHELMHDLLPHGTLTVIENAGHLPTLEQPRDTIDAMSRWLGDLCQ